MELDWRICSRARLARDARFDGKFFIGVLSTRIYCRPICRSRTSKESNVRYFPTAAAAAEAGFRPCLRCRPECSPGTPAWAGTRNTVTRALRLISESGLENGGVEGLAERLGVGSRHLRRLFEKYLGATPTAVAQTRRIHFAKKLLDETNLRMAEIALAAGFGSVRRFNATIQGLYHRTPTQIRRLAVRLPKQRENEYLFRLGFRPPYNWKRTIEFLAAQAMGGVEVVESGCYRRTIAAHGSPGYFEVSFDAPQNALAVRVQFGESRSLFFIIERIRAMFDLDADWGIITRTLQADPQLAQMLRAEAGLRVPGCWDGFELATRAILARQTNASVAEDLTGKIVRSFGQRFSPAPGLNYVFPEPQALAKADLTEIGLPGKTAATIRLFAAAVCSRQISFNGMADNAAFRVQLCGIPGVDRWIAEYVAMRALRDPDALPVSGFGAASGIRDCITSKFEGQSEIWRPWRAYAVMLLWQNAAHRTSSELAPVPSKRSAPARALLPERTVDVTARLL